MSQVAYDAELAQTSAPLPTSYNQSSAAFTAIVDHTINKSITYDEMLEEFKDAGIRGPELDEEGEIIVGDDVSPIEFWESIADIVVAAIEEGITIETDNLLLNLAFNDRQPLYYFQANEKAYFTLIGTWRKKFDQDPPLPIPYLYVPTPEASEAGNESDQDSEEEDEGEEDESEVEEVVEFSRASSVRRRERKEGSAFLDSLGFGNGPVLPQVPVVKSNILSTSTDVISDEQLYLQAKKTANDAKEKSNNSNLLLPLNARTTLMLYRVYQEKEKETGEKQLQNRQNLSVSNNIPPTIMFDILCGRGADFKKIAANDHTTVVQEFVFASEELEKFSGRKQLPSKEITTSSKWQVVFRHFKEFYGHFFPHLIPELDHYHSFIFDQMVDTPSKVHLYIEFDRQFRQKLLSPTIALNSYYQAVNTPLFITTISNIAGYQAPSQSESSGSSNKRKADGKGSSSKKQICRNFNSKGCEFGSECRRIHECSSCGSSNHSEISCEKKGKKDGGVGLIGNEELGSSPGHDLSGTGIAPRIRRQLHWPRITSIHSPAVDATLTAEPLPTIPLSVSQDPTINSLLEKFPFLFKTSTPIDINCFTESVAQHPNRPYVNSILNGLKHGFWNGHHGNFSATLPSSKRPKHETYQLEEEDWEIIRTQVEKDYEAGYLSDAFQQIQPGMVVSPIFTTNPSNGGRKRGVVDQTGSGLNDGIAQQYSQVQYDTLFDLGRTMRYYSRTKINPSKIVGWKSDVSSAFRNLPVSKHWQVKQVIKIRYNRPNGSHYYLYYIDQRLVLGCAAAPKIWCSFFALVMWAVHFKSRIKASQYVDDVFGVDISGLRLQSTHPKTLSKTLRPQDQALLLDFWTYISLPWAENKQEDSTTSVVANTLTILGHAVNFKLLSITLPQEAKLAFALSVKNFLATPGGRPLLKDWRKIAGYSSFANAVIPFARPALTSLYIKIGNKSNRNAPVNLNNDVRFHLAWFAQELLQSPPLYILDPGLEEWSFNDADLILYTDACCKANGTLKPGLGFWTQFNNKRLGFYHRSNSHSDDIYYLEALAIFSAIEWAVQFAPKRLLVYSDSALSIFAFDAGRGNDVVRPLIWSSFLSLKKFKTNLRVLHIAGDDNNLADDLSRKTATQLHLENNFHSITHFIPPTVLVGVLD